MDAEDIFKDWKFNFDNKKLEQIEQRKKAAVAARNKTRTRKLSNRALRKELLKEIGTVQ